MTRYSDFNDIKMKKVCDIIGIDKFLEITEAINGQIYIPKKTAFVRKLILEDADVFLESLNEIDSLEEAALKFKVNTKTIRNWVSMALEAKKTRKKKGRNKNANQLARALL